MPLIHQEVSATRAWGLWKIEEPEDLLRQWVSENTPQEITHAEKRLEYLAVRTLIKKLLLEWRVNFEGLIKNEHGKPFLKNLNYHVSLSHSFPYVTAILDKEKVVGIDLEHSKAKLLKIASRMLHQREYEDAGKDVAKLCIYWCAKEAMLKMYGKKDLIFAENLLVEPFILEKTGNFVGRIIVDNLEKTIPLYYRMFKGFAIVYNQ